MANKMPEQMKVSKKLKENLEAIKHELSIDENFDVMLRDVQIAGRDAALLFVDGFAKDLEMLQILNVIQSLKREDVAPNTIKKLIQRYIGYIEVETVETVNEAIDEVLAGPLALIIDGQDEIILLDVREYPARGPEEPDLEKVVRGSRDGFVETLVFNTALIRRRVRDPNLRMEVLQAGTRSKNDICVSYIKDIANEDLVDQVKDLINSIEIDGLPMAEKAIEELITPGSHWNPFPKIRYTERPDVAAVHLLEGHVLVIVDNSPSVIILPTTYFHHLQHVEEYRQSPTVGVYLRWVRFIAIFASIFALPLWFLFSIQPELLPEGLAFIGPEEVGAIPLFWQFIIAEIAIDFLRMAAIHTPAPLATSLGLIAAILIGEVAIDIGLFIPEVLLYAAVAAVGTFSTPSYELSNANRLVRLFLLIMIALFQLPGAIAGILITLIYLGMTKSFGVPYLWPLFPLNIKALGRVMVRPPVAIQNVRPSILKTKDYIRQSSPATKPLKKDETEAEENDEEKEKK
ncbi:stage V sporulation protein AF [Desulfitispora alkaliphila]|uniref:spore germination protein n=1 Tax=Desulfitispora alkaliphila TaxID=622674 RepID=UPI003D1BA758